MDFKFYALVKRGELIEVFGYNTPYLRVCQSEFSLNELQSQKHNTNFNIQRNYASHKSDFFLSIDQFLDYIKENHR